MDLPQLQHTGSEMLGSSLVDDLADMSAAGEEDHVEPLGQDSCRSTSR